MVKDTKEPPAAVKIYVSSDWVVVVGVDPTKRTSSTDFLTLE